MGMGGERAGGVCAQVLRGGGGEREGRRGGEGGEGRGAAGRGEEGRGGHLARQAHYELHCHGASAQHERQSADL